MESGTGGGLCQLANLMYWMARTPGAGSSSIHHHGADLFPDDDRIQPFGSGVTVFYDYVDLRFCNQTDHTLQLQCGADGTTTCGARSAATARRLRCTASRSRDHRFVRGPDGTVTRENELWRLTLDAATNEVKVEIHPPEPGRGPVIRSTRRSGEGVVGGARAVGCVQSE